MKIEDAFTPIIDKMTTDNEGKRLLQEVISIVHSKEYLLHPETIKKCPSQVSYEPTMSTEEREKLKHQWEIFYKKVCEDRQEALHEYLKLVGIKEDEIKPLDDRPLNIDLAYPN